MTETSNIYNQNQGKIIEINKNLTKIIPISLLKPIVNVITNINKIIVLSRKYYKIHLNNSKHIGDSQSHKHKQTNNESDSTASSNKYSSTKTNTEDIKSLNMSHFLSTAKSIGMKVNQSLKNKSQFISLAKQMNLVNDEKSLIQEDNIKHTSKTNDHKGVKKQSNITEKTTADNKTIIGELER